MNRAIFGLLAAVLLASCGGGDGGGSAAECVATTNLTMIDNEFEPQCLEVSPGDTINLANEGQAVHSLTVESAGIDVDVRAGETATATLEGIEAGSTDLTCTFHPEMTGTLQVG
ncbi:MAG: cupredoxin domain-containing protein [Actinomycetota bacterium]